MIRRARLIADPAVRADPAPFADEMRRRGPIVRGRALLMTFDYDVATELLRSDGLPGVAARRKPAETVALGRGQD